jgi:uncharacterized membrane protein
MNPQIDTMFDSVSFFFVTLILYLLSVLSKRLGKVMGMRKYYYLYYTGMVLTLTASMVLILSFNGNNISEGFSYGYVLFAAGLTFGLVAIIKYWGWLIREIIKG